MRITLTSVSSCGRLSFLVFPALICAVPLAAVAQTAPQQQPSRPTIPPIEGLEELSGLGQLATPKLADWAASDR